MDKSPYESQPKSNWQKITDKLITDHPLSLDQIREISLYCWQILWSTKIGSGKTIIDLKDVTMPATVISYFFEKLVAKELQTRFPEQWRGAEKKDEKDLVYLPDNRFSIEVKCSGQLGTKVYGNRSYGQKGLRDEQERKDKSGYYITVNFYERTLILIRFGWIDLSDWRPQKAPTGQMAGLPDDVYEYKLTAVPGDYRLNAPAGILGGVGPKTAGYLAQNKISTIKDLLRYSGSESMIVKLKEAAAKFQSSFK